MNDTTAGDLLERARTDLGATAIVEFNHDLLESLTCGTCHQTRPLLASLGKVTESQGRCPKCGELSTPNVYHTVSADSRVLDRTLSELGVPPWDIVIGRAGMKRQGYELAGDRDRVLGPLAIGEDRP